MKKVLIGVAVLVVLIAIALQARDQLVEEPAPESTPRATDARIVEPPGTMAEDDVGVVARDRAGDARSAVGAGSTATSDETRGATDGAASARPDPTSGGTVPVSDPGERAGGGSAPASDEADARGTAPGAQLDAETVLERASEAYEAMRSMRAEFTQRLDNRLLGREITSRGMLYQRHPDRFLMRFTQPDGDVIVGDGEYFWIYYPSANDDQVIRTPMSAGAGGGVDLQAQFVGDPTDRFDATLEGTESVDGRPAHVLTLRPTRPLGYRMLKVWIDADDYLARRFEITENNGNVRHMRLEELTVNPRLDDSLFRFEPPEGVRIIDRG